MFLPDLLIAVFLGERLRFADRRDRFFREFSHIHTNHSPCFSLSFRLRRNERGTPCRRHIFNKQILVDALEEDSKIEGSNHDFGKNVIPMLLNQGKNVFIYNFNENHFTGITEKEKGYWRDVGCIDAYWQANMDLLDYEPELNLYSKEWPIRTFNYNYPPAKFIWQQGDRVGMATNSMVSEGCIVSGGTLSRCVLSPKVKINSYSQVSDSILMENVNIGRYSEIRKAIIDKNVDVPPYTKIGVDRDEDIRRGFYVSEGGVTVVPKNARL